MCSGKNNSMCGRGLGLNVCTVCSTHQPTWASDLTHLKLFDSIKAYPGLYYIRPSLSVFPFDYKIQSSQPIILCLTEHVIRMPHITFVCFGEMLPYRKRASHPSSQLKRLGQKTQGLHAHSSCLHHLPFPLPVIGQNPPLPIICSF